MLHTGPAAFDAALNTVNVGKFNLGFASIGICEHAFYEAITHAHNRVLYGRKVTDFPHVAQMLTDAYARLLGMKLFGERSIDYFRAASAEDRRYLLYNPITKMKVTTEGERVIDLLWDVIAARGFEQDTYFEMAASDIRALPKLEGTVHVNMALVLKFMAAYFFMAEEQAPVPQRREAADDPYLFAQGPARGLSKIRFHDWRPVYDRFADLPNVARFIEQAAGIPALLQTAPPDEDQQRDLGFMLTLGELFTLVVYGQLILEQAELTGQDRDVDRPALRRPGARLLGVRDRPARQAVHDGGPAGVGARARPRAGRGRRAVRPRLRAGDGALRRLRDARREPRERPCARIQGIVSSLIDTLLDRTVAPGYTRVGYAVRSHGWDPLPRMDGKVVLVTGATAGLGRAAAEGFARLGASVRLLARDAGRGEEARAAIARATGNDDVRVGIGDLSDLASVRRFADGVPRRPRSASTCS